MCLYTGCIEGGETIEKRRYNVVGRLFNIVRSNW